MKRCAHCRINKPATDFHVKKASPDGRRVICRKCARAYVNAWRAQGRLNAWRRRAAVIATTEAEVLAALAQPRPFYAELTQ